MPEMVVPKWFHDRSCLKKSSPNARSTITISESEQNQRFGNSATVQSSYLELVFVSVLVRLLTGGGEGGPEENDRLISF